jgi:hypothetical protein
LRTTGPIRQSVAGFVAIDDSKLGEKITRRKGAGANAGFR